MTTLNQWPTEATTIDDTDWLPLKRGTGINSDKKISGANVKAQSATLAQGALADSATQPGDNISTLVNDSGFTDDQTDAEIATAYQTEVPLISQIDAEAGVATPIESWSALRVAQAIAALGGVGGGSMDDLIDDLTPQLGGNLDVNGKEIQSATGIVLELGDNAGVNRLDVQDSDQENIFKVLSNGQVLVRNLGTGTPGLSFMDYSTQVDYDCGFSSDGTTLSVIMDGAYTVQFGDSTLGYDYFRHGQIVFAQTAWPLTTPGSQRGSLFLKNTVPTSLRFIDGADVEYILTQPEGINILSTGEAGGVNFLGENGDGTCSWKTGPGGGDAWGDPVDADIIPDADGTRDIGGPSLRFSVGFFDALSVDGNIAITGTVDSRDLSIDGAKLDGIEDNATAGFTSIINDETNDNYAIGPNALDSTTPSPPQGQNNLAWGRDAGTGITIGERNIFFGNLGTGKKLTVGSWNIAIGSEAMSANTLVDFYGSSNISIGDWTLPVIESGDSNIGIGDSVFSALISGSENISIGEGSGFALISGQSNIFLGYGCGNVVSGNQNICIGDTYANPLDSTADRQIVVGKTLAGYMEPLTDVDVSDKELVMTGPSALPAATVNQDGGVFRIRGGKKATAGGIQGDVAIEALIQTDKTDITKEVDWDLTTITSSNKRTITMPDKNVDLGRAKSKSIIIELPTAAEDLSYFFTDVAITIVQMRAVLVGSATPSVTWTVRHDADRNAVGTEVVTGGTVTTDTTTGSDVTSFDDATIVADSHIWIETTAQSGTVGSIIITLFYEED